MHSFHSCHISEKFASKSCLKQFVTFFIFITLVKNLPQQVVSKKLAQKHRLKNVSQIFRLKSWTHSFQMSFILPQKSRLKGSYLMVVSQISGSKRWTQSLAQAWAACVLAQFESGSNLFTMSYFDFWIPAQTSRDIFSKAKG